MKTVVYFCNCGTNIAERIDAEAVRSALEPDKAAPVFKTVPFLCSEEGKAFLRDDLERERPDRIVVAACSPREHEETFMRVMEEAGMNPYLMQMVNIREQIAWVTADREAACRKAAAAIRAALRRVALHDPLEREALEVCADVLVVGAGPAGLKAAAALAEAGRRVILVEKSPVIGGLPVLFEELFPDMECAPCMLEPLMGEILHGRLSERIELLTLAEVSDVSGYFGNFEVRIRQRPRYVDPHQCIGCGECFEPCPASAPNLFNAGMDEKKAIAFPFFGGLPNVPFIDPALCTRFTQGSDCAACSAACPMGEGVIRFDEEEAILERWVGAVILAVGASLYDCSRFGSLGYSRLPDVKTALEFERLLASNGPTGGAVVTSAGEAPRSVAFIHCVGSLDEEHRPYCSGLCCQVALKFSHLLESKLPECEIRHLYREIVAPGKDGHSLLRAVRANPRTAFLRYGHLSELSVAHEGGVQTLRLAGGEVVEADMIVLCPAIVPGEDAQKLARIFDVPLDRFGFFEEEHGRLEASRGKLRGVYLAGACQSPGDIQRAASQAMAAAGHVLSELVEGRKVPLEPIFASVRPEMCSGCRVCAAVCPYKAIGFDHEKGVSQINAVLCRGCGTCAAACPLGAIDARHFTREMIEAEIEEVLR